MKVIRLLKAAVNPKTTPPHGNRFWAPDLVRNDQAQDGKNAKGQNPNVN
jgi:hypothetical protein